jgi:addiction module HigA family antidote
MTRVRTHPGEVLREEYLLPLGMSARALAKALGVPANRITEIMRGERDVSADTAIRLGRYFRTDISRPLMISPWPNPETIIPTSDLARQHEEQGMWGNVSGRAIGRADSARIGMKHP